VVDLYGGLSMILRVIMMVFLFNTATLAQENCLLKMAYKDGDKLPLIAATPNNSGIYHDVFNLAAKRIGCELTISRLPKKRLHVALRKGELDFYPGASFSVERSEYLLFIQNGMNDAEYGLTPATVPDINSFDDVKKYNLVWLMELGSSKFELANRLGIPTNMVSSVDIFKARRLFAKQRASFYVVDKGPLLYYPERAGIGSFEQVNLKVHHNCCGGEYPMYMAFSRSSSHYLEAENPEFDITKPVAPSNQNMYLDESSLAFKFANELVQMKAEGVTEDIYQNHFK